MSISSINIRILHSILIFFTKFPRQMPKLTFLLVLKMAHNTYQKLHVMDHYHRHIIPSPMRRRFGQEQAFKTPKLMKIGLL